MPSGRRVTRYYIEPDASDDGITRSRLGRLGRERQTHCMRVWFETHYEDPNQEMPWVEGEYIYPVGGPYNAYDELYNEFAGTVPNECISALAEDLVSAGTLEWAPTHNHPDFIAAMDDMATEAGVNQPTMPPDLDNLLQLLRQGARVNLGSSEERAERKRFIKRVVATQQLIRKRRNRTAGIGHNNPPPDSPEEAETERAVDDAEQTAAEIVADLQKPSPNVIQIAETTSRLGKLGKWLGDRVNKGSDVLIGIGINQFVTHIHDIEIACTHWIEAVIAIF